MSKKDKELYLIEINTKYKALKKAIFLGFNVERQQYALYFIKDVQKYFSSPVPDTFYYIIQTDRRDIFKKLYDVTGYGYKKDMTNNTTDLLFFANDNFTVASFRRAIRTVTSDVFPIIEILGYKKEEKPVEEKKTEIVEVNKSFGHTFEGLFGVSEEVETEEQPKKKLQGIEKLAKSYDKLKNDILSSNIESVNKENAVSLLEESFKILSYKKEENIEEKEAQ